MLTPANSSARRRDAAKIGVSRSYAELRTDLLFLPISIHLKTLPSLFHHRGDVVHCHTMQRSFLPLIRNIQHGPSRLPFHLAPKFPLQQLRHMSLPQIMFNATHPHITIPSASGPLYRNIRPSFPKNADKVVAELNALFADQAPSSATSSASSGIWQLEATCDAISAVFILPSKAQVVELLRSVLDVAEELKHHPNISGVEAVGGTWVLLVTCGTHRPAGLSVKDPRLARRVGEIVGEGLEGRRAGEEVVGADGLEEWHWRENMGRARASMDVGVEEEGGEERRLDEQRYWRLNTVEDVEALVRGEEGKKCVEGNGLTLRGLVL